MELKPSYFVEKEELVFCLIIAEIDNPMNLDIFVLYVDLTWLQIGTYIQWNWLVASGNCLAFSIHT